MSAGDLGYLIEGINFPKEHDVPLVYLKLGMTVIVNPYYILAKTEITVKNWKRSFPTLSDVLKS